MEDYKKKYEEALERAKSYQKWNKSAVITAIFPELVESKGTKDEKIREALISVLTSDFEKDTTINDITVEEIVTWLEKQEQKPQGKSALEAAKEVKIDNQNYIKPANKVEPKFKAGNWVVWDNKISCHIDNIYQGKWSLMYTITDTNNMIRSYSVKGFDNNAHLWTLLDAKDGDVLQFKGRPFIYNGYLEEKKYPFAYGGIYLDGSFFISNGSLPWAHSDVYPATKEQRDILFQKMKEAGYEWNAEKKELKKIEWKSIEWTEEDTNMFGSIRSTLSMYMNNLSLPKEIRDIHKEELKWLDELYDRGLS